MNSILVLFWAFYEICLFRKQPQNLPTSSFLMTVCMVTYGSTSVILTLAFQDFTNASLTGLIDVCLVLLLTYLLLYFKEITQRWIQTSTALLGTGTFFGLIAIPLYFALAIDGIDGSYNFLISLAILVLVFWNIAVMAHILKYALSTSFTVGILVSLIYVIFIASIISTVVPQQAV